MSKSIFTGGKDVATSVTQIWYSLWLSEDDFQLVIRTLQELIEAASLEELTGGAMKVSQVQLKRMAEVWSTWLQISSRGGDWITQARCRRFQDAEVRERTEIPKEHKKSASEWFANSILSPKQSRKVLPLENFTLTGSDFSYNRNKGDFTYKIKSSVFPFSGWDYKEVRQWGHSSSILKMYSEYVSHVLGKCALKLATGQVKFYFLLCNCMEIGRFLPPDQKYDRVTTSNIADYVPLTKLLDTCKPLLNPSNPSSVIITEFHRWIQFTNLITEAAQRAHLTPPGGSLRKKVLEDTKDLAIANSTSGHTFWDYHDHSAEFIQFLRACLLISEISDERNRRRTWKSMADHNGLITRNFLRCQNRVFPTRWTLNCRSVSNVNVFVRAVEWIVIPQ